MENGTKSLIAPFAPVLLTEAFRTVFVIQLSKGRFGKQFYSAFAIPLAACYFGQILRSVRFRTNCLIMYKFRKRLH